MTLHENNVMDIIVDVEKKNAVCLKLKAILRYFVSRPCITIILL